MKLPPLNALRAFESAARQQSFTQAATEHCVSAASITRFIKILEDYLGFQLFHRHASGVSLTPAGESYYLSVHALFIELEKLTATAQQTQQQTLRILAIPAIAETWLVNRLWQFQQLHKEIEINLTFDNRKNPVLADGFSEHDIWLCYDQKPSEDTVYMPLSKDELLLVCSPEMANKLQKPRDLFNYPLLTDEDWQSDWQNWLAHNHLPEPTQFNECFERYSMVVNAAISGAGLMIGHRALIKAYLDMGVLLMPKLAGQVDFKPAQTNKGFYAIGKNHTNRASQCFLNWLKTVGQ